MGKTFSASSITKFLRNEHRTVSVESIYNYLRWLEQAFIIYPATAMTSRGRLFWLPRRSIIWPTSH